MFSHTTLRLPPVAHAAHPLPCQDCIVTADSAAAEEFLRVVDRWEDRRLDRWEDRWLGGRVALLYGCGWSCMVRGRYCTVREGHLVPVRPRAVRRVRPLGASNLGYSWNIPT